MLGDADTVTAAIDAFSHLAPVKADPVREAVRRAGGREVTAACNVGADDEVVDVVRDR